MGEDGQTLGKDGEFEQCYVKVCNAAPTGVKIIAQNTQRVDTYDELFYAPVSVNNMFQMQGMLDSGSMACTFSVEAEGRMLSDKVLTEPKPMT